MHDLSVYISKMNYARIISVHYISKKNYARIISVHYISMMNYARLIKVKLPNIKAKLTKI